VTDWSIVISDIASPADEAVLRDAIDEFNLAATGYREVRSLSCFLSADGVLVHPRVNDSDVLCWSDATFSIEAQAW
jgi:hypothetical protein